MVSSLAACPPKCFCFPRLAYFFNCFQWEHFVFKMSGVRRDTEHLFIEECSTLGKTQRSSLSRFSHLTNHSGRGAGLIPRRPTVTLCLYYDWTTMEKLILLVSAYSWLHQMEFLDYHNNLEIWRGISKVWFPSLERSWKIMEFTVETMWTLTKMSVTYIF